MQNANNTSDQATSIGSTRIIITGVDMTFSEMVVFIIKLSIASIPAFFIAGIIYMIFSAILMSVFAGVVSMVGM